MHVTVIILAAAAGLSSLANPSPSPRVAPIAQSLSVQMDGAFVADAHMQANVLGTKHVLHCLVCAAHQMCVCV